MRPDLSQESRQLRRPVNRQAIQSAFGDPVGGIRGTGLLRVIRQCQMPVAEEGQGSGDGPHIVRIADAVEDEQGLSGNCEPLAFKSRQDALRRRDGHRDHPAMEHRAGDSSKLAGLHHAIGATPFRHAGTECADIGRPAFLVEQPDHPVRRLPEECADRREPGDAERVFWTITRSGL